MNQMRWSGALVREPSDLRRQQEWVHQTSAARAAAEFYPEILWDPDRLQEVSQGARPRRNQNRFAGNDQPLWHRMRGHARDCLRIPRCDPANKARQRNWKIQGT